MHLISCLYRKIYIYIYITNCFKIPNIIQKERKVTWIKNSSSRNNFLMSLFSITDVVFRKHSYIFVVVNGRTFGTIGKIEARSRSGKPITYRLLSYHPFVKIDENDGSIEINYKRSQKTKYFSARSQVTTFRVGASTPLQNNRCKFRSCRRCQHNTWVRIIAIPLYFGDKIIQSLQKRLSTIVKINRLPRAVSPYSLYRVVRWISPRVNTLSTMISSAKARLDNACTQLIWAIKAHFKSM